MGRQGVIIDPILTHRGGLLPDLDKIETLHQVMGHGEMAAEFIMKAGFTEMAEMVRGHIMHTILRPGADDRSWETKLVYFVDKLVEGDRLVSFDTRLAALKKRYPAYRGTMIRAESAVWAVNEQICAILSLADHNELISLLKYTL